MPTLAVFQLYCGITTKMITQVVVVGYIVDHYYLTFIFNDTIFFSQMNHLGCDATI
jgi:hypothetical protein